MPPARGRAMMMPSTVLTRMRRHAVSLLLLSPALACGGVTVTAPSETTDSSPTATTPPSDDASPPRASSADASTSPSASACALANTAPPANARLLGEDAPALVGGTLVDGLYGLTDSTTYLGHGGLSAPIGPLQETLRVSDSGSSFAFVSTNTYPTGATSRGTWVTKGKALTTTTECGPGLSVNEFTATPTSIILADTSRREVTLSTYTRMP